jgi:CubicO group peptidase (beta-lactamase class C family)
MNHHIRLSLATILSLFIVTNICASESGGRKAVLKAGVDSILESQVRLGKIPGAVIQIKEGDRILCRQAFGYAMKYDYDHEPVIPPEKMTVSHMFDLASLTKVIGTTTSIMLLADRGLLSIDDPAGKYIPAFNSVDKKEITLRHLLTHTAGLYEWYPLYYLVSDKEECYRLIGGLPLRYPIGEGRHYSDLGFIILGQIIEKVSGMPLETFMRDNIFLPLRMNETTYNPLASGRFGKIAATSAGNPYEKRMVYDSTLGYQVKEIDPRQWDGWRTYMLRGEVNDGNAWYANGGVAGSAGLFSTVTDLQKIVDMLINKGMTRSGPFLSPETVTAFLTKDKYNNGLGWMMDPGNSFMKDAPEGSFGHTGFTGTSIAVIPSAKVSVILLINRQNTGLSEEGLYYNPNPVRLQIFRAVIRYLSEED